MAGPSSIEWTDVTWNPVTGCTKISEGCRFCYAERMAHRLQAMGQARYKNGFAVTLQSDQLKLPLDWKKPKKIFVNSMSDLYHKEVSDEYILKVFNTMQAAHWHTFQVLTKRADRLKEIAAMLPWPMNVWQGVSVEGQRAVWRIDALREVPAAVRFLSIEPLIEPLANLNLTGIDWVIVGGESGPGARPMEQGWVREIRNHCLDKGIAFYFKQWGGVVKSNTGRTLDGQTWDCMPKPIDRSFGIAAK